MRVKVTVTNEHITKGQGHSSTKCPIVLAMNEAVGGKWVVGKTRYRRESFERNVLRGQPLPDVAVAFIDALDHDRKVSPFSFDVEVGGDE